MSEEEGTHFPHDDKDWPSDVVAPWALATRSKPLQQTKPTPIEVGAQYGRLIVVSQGISDGGTWWWCDCACGNTVHVRASNLRSGHTLSCGCLRREKASARATERNTKHGLTSREGRHPLYEIWHSMRDRCLNPNHPCYHMYGGRGITICERWNDFAAWLADMGPRPEGRFPSGRPHYSLDRRDNDGNYEPTNCRWATALEQRHNRRAHGAA